MEKICILMNDHKSCTLLLICGCKCICAVWFSGCYACTIFLFELPGLTSREWFGEENFLSQKLVFMDVDQNKMREIVLEQQQCEPISTSLNDANDGK